MQKGAPKEEYKAEVCLRLRNQRFKKDFVLEHGVASVGSQAAVNH
jgi:hypothetical protein